MDPSEHPALPPESTLHQQREYWCFISYRHVDNKEPGRKWATWLHQALETYEVPADLVGRKNERGDLIPDRIFPVFRDEVELPADAQLSKPIEAALLRSRFLVVLCSPQAVQSPYVSAEILRFKQLGKNDRILAAIIEGSPNASYDPAQGGSAMECFPHPLRYTVDAQGQITGERTEPIAPDFRLSEGTPGWTSPAAYRQALEAEALPARQIRERVDAYSEKTHLMLLKIIAGVLGVPLGVLTQRDKAYQLAKARKRARILYSVASGFAVLLALAIFGGVVAWQQRGIAKANEEELSNTLGASYFLEGNARLRDVSTAREGLAYLARSVRDHGHQMSANRLLTFLQQRTVWILEDSGKATINAPAPRRAQQKRLRIAGPPSDEPGKTDLVAEGPQGQIAVSWCEGTESDQGYNHPGMGLHHFRVLDKSGKPLTSWIKADHEAIHWVSDITDMVFSPDGSCLAVTVGRWRQPEYLQVWHVGSGQQIGETIIATGENPNSQGASFTFVKFGAVSHLHETTSCDLLAGSSRGDAYWISCMNLSGTDDPYSNEIAVVSHRSALQSAHLQTGENVILVTGSADGEVRFTSDSDSQTNLGAPSLKLGRPIIDINADATGMVIVTTDDRLYRAAPISPVQLLAESVEPPRLVVHVEDDHEITVQMDSENGEVLLKKVISENIKARDGVAVHGSPPSLRVSLEDGTVLLYKIENGTADLIASGKGRSITFLPNAHPVKITLQGTLADLRLVDQPMRVITATTDFVYQVFDPQSGMALSKPLDEKILFSQGAAPSAVGGLWLSPSGHVLLSHSQHWDPPNVMLGWSTLWDCNTGEPLSDRVSWPDEEGIQYSVMQPFVKDDTANVGAMMVHTAHAAMFPLLADIAEELAGMTLNGSGELLHKAQSKETVVALLRRLQPLGRQK